MSKAQGIVPRVDFIQAWQTSNSVGEAANKVERNKASVSARATSLRKQGVNLKKMPRGRKAGLTQEEVKEANGLIEELSQVVE